MIGKVQFIRHAQSVCTLGLLTLVLAACGGKDIDISKYSSVHEAVDAATGPLEDLNIKKRELPEPLQLALRNPYAKPAQMKCEGAKEEIAALDAVLGPDMGPREEKPGEGEFMSLANLEGEMPSADGVPMMAFNSAKDFALDTVRSKVNIIPFRSIIRKVTGADRYQKKVTLAYEAGKLRRAFLKGYAEERFGTKCMTLPVVIESKKPDAQAEKTEEAKPHE